MTFVAKNTDFKGRLSALFTRDGYTGWGWSERAADEMYERELLDLKHEYKGINGYEEGNEAIARLKSTAANRMRIHINTCQNASEVSGEWIVRYCRFFDCSAAFLFGEINDPRFQDTDIQRETGLKLSAIKTLREYQIIAMMEGKNKNPTADIVSFLLQKKHCNPNAGGLLHLIFAYLTSDDFSVKDMDPSMEYIHTDGDGGSGFTLNTAEVVRAAIPNMILQRLEEYRQEKQKGL